MFFECFNFACVSVRFFLYENIFFNDVVNRFDKLFEYARNSVIANYKIHRTINDNRAY